MVKVSDALAATSFLARWDPTGAALAVATGSSVTVWDAEVQLKLATWPCGDEVQQIEWSPNGDFLFCGMFKTSQIKVFHKTAGTFSCHIDESAAGCVRAMWAPTSQSLIVFSDYELRISVWFLDSGTQGLIENAGRRKEKGVSFHNTYAAVAERRDTKDFIGLYDTRDWLLLKRFPVQTIELESVDWTPNGSFLIVADTYLEYTLLVYSVDGRCLHKFSACDNELGIKLVRISSMSLVAIGSYDEKARLLDHIQFSCCAEFSHPAVVTLPQRIFKEVEFMPDVQLASSSDFLKARSPTMQIRFDLSEGSVSIPNVIADMQQPNPKLGVGLLEFSPRGRFIVTRNDNMPTALWIWDVARLQQIALLITKQPIRSVRWNPITTPDKDLLEDDCKLAFCCGTQWVFIWSLKQIECCQIPINNFAVQAIQWHPNGSVLCLSDKDRCCVAFFS